jgi:dCMP deaminase
MMVALCSAQRSADPNSQVGCCLVDTENKIISTGYNGPPRGIPPAAIPWKREGEPGTTKYDFICHAENNAIYNAVRPTKNAKCYVTLFPCNNCTIGLIQAGIREVIYFDDKYKDKWFSKLAMDMFSRVNILVRKHKWSKDFIETYNQLSNYISNVPTP